jgi:hypothetical protein
MSLSPRDLSRLQKSWRGQNPRQARSRIVTSNASTRDQSVSLAALRGAVAVGSASGTGITGTLPKGTTIVSITSGNPGVTGRVFLWGVAGFGWTPEASTDPPASTEVYWG